MDGSQSHPNQGRADTQAHGLDLACLDFSCQDTSDDLNAYETSFFPDKF